VDSWGLQDESERKVDDTTADVAIVTTAFELLKEIKHGSPHIEIREHINLSGLNLAEKATHVLGDVPSGVLSIQVSDTVSHDCSSRRAREISTSKPCTHEPQPPPLVNVVTS
jgi:hypothetical protein